MSSYILYPKLVESKTSANEVTHIEWNPRIDLLATVFSNGVLTCSHLLSLQKVWHKNKSGKIISIAWRPDGRVLAIGAFADQKNEYVCSLHDVENHKTIMSLRFKAPITSVNWFQYCCPIDEKASKEETYLESIKKVSSRDKRINNPESTDPTFSHQLAYEQNDLNILLVSTADGKINLYALGLFKLGSLDVFEPPCNDDYEIGVTNAHMSTCMEYTTTIINSINTQNKNSTLTMKTYRFDLFKNSSYEFLRVAKMYAKIMSELEYLDDTVNAITTSWADVLAGLDNKLSSYCSRKSKNPDESDNNYTFLSADELLQLLVIGYPSDNLEKFLADMSDKGLNKLNNAIEQTCLRVQNLIVKNAQKCCYHLHSDLNQLRGMSINHKKYEKVGLDDKFIVDAMKGVGSLVLKLTELQQVIDHSLKSTKSFFRWLISVASRVLGEQNNLVPPSDLNKTTQQDIQLITDFILENFDYNSNDLDTFGDSNEVASWAADQGGSSQNNSNVYSNRPTCSNFTLEQVGQYLKNEPLSRLKYSFSKPHSNFWIEFFKKRPELTDWKSNDNGKSTTLLFYPHNEQTSLIQEYKNTCKTIQDVFKCVPDSIDKSLTEPIEMIDIKDFIRNSPANRVKVETNIKMSQHYTLFQTKANPVNKQYLMVQSLVDASFRLICIKFQVPKGSILAESQKQGSTSKVGIGMRDTTSITICDSSFYEVKETKRFLLTFLLLDTFKNDTLILQVELNKLLDNYNCSVKQVKDFQRIFRSDDSIDKNSTKITLELDIYSEPPCERTFPFNIVVKKIKDTTGKDMFSSSGRGVVAFTSSNNKRLHLYELESIAGGGNFEEVMVDDEVEVGEKIDDSLIDADPMG